MRKIPIKTTEEKFYRQFLELLRSIPPFNKLRSRELDVLGQILYQNNKYKSIDVDTRHLIIFSKEVRAEMRDNLNISEAVFNNNLSGLKKYKLITEDNKIMKYLEDIQFNNNFILEFKFYN